MTSFMIADGNGDALTAGVQWHAVARMAQQMADSRGDSVWVYGPDDTDETAERFDPINDAEV